MKLFFTTFLILSNYLLLEAQVLSPAGRTIPLCTKAMNENSVSLTLESKSKELKFANGIVPVGMTLTFNTSAKLNHSVLLVYSDKKDTVCLQPLRMYGWKKAAFPLHILLRYSSSALPFFYQKVKVLLRNNLTKSIDASSNVYVYFTPYGTTEVWNENDFEALPRTWATPTTVRPKRVTMSRNNIPVSDLTTEEFNNDSIPKSYISVEGLAYTIVVKETLDVDNEDDDKIDSTSVSRAMYRKASNFRTWTGVVRGRLVTNVNGIDIPITGIKVTIMQQDKRPTWLSTCGGVDDKLAVVSTDNDGFFFAGISAEYRVGGGRPCMREGDALELYIIVESKTLNNSIRVERRSGKVRECTIRENDIYNWNNGDANPDMGTMNVDKDIKPQLLHWANQSQRFAFEQLGPATLPMGARPLVICIAPQFFGQDEAFFLPANAREQMIVGSFVLPVASIVGPLSFGYIRLNFTNEDGLYIGEDNDNNEETTQHEFGHYLMYYLQGQSWLSPLKAGFASHSYTDNAENINIAWTEGWANGFSFIMDAFCHRYDGESGTEANRWVADFYRFENRTIGFERPENRFNNFGIGDIRPTITHGFASEYNIAAFLFDLFDGPNNNQLNGGNGGQPFADVNNYRDYAGRTNDRVELSFRQICQPLLDNRGTGGYINQGSRLINHIHGYHNQLIKSMSCAMRGRITQLSLYNGLTSFENVTTNFRENPVPEQSFNSDFIERGGSVKYDKFTSENNQWRTDGNYEIGFMSGLNIAQFQGVGQSYNLGGSFKNDDINLSDNLTVRDATLMLNVYRPIDFPATSNSFPIKGSVLNVNLCGENELRLVENARLRLGDEINRNATMLSISDYGVVRAEAGTEITLHSSSSIVVKSGGTLTIQSGATLNLRSKSQLLVEPGGYICIESGAIVNLSPESTIKIDIAAIKGVRSDLGIPFSICGSRYVPGFNRDPACPTEALSFDGIDDYISIPDNSSINFGSSDFTVEAFIKPMAPVKQSVNLYIASKVLFSSEGPNSTGFGLLVEPTGGLFGWTMNSNNTSYARYTSANDANLIDGKCHYVAFQRQGSNYRLFIDGYSVDTDKAAPDYMPDNVSSSNDIFIGNSNPNDNYTQPFKGWIGEFRLWNYARSAEQIANSKAALTGSQTGLVAWYDMDDNAQSLTDLSAAGNTAELGSTEGEDSNDPTWLGRCEIDCSVENNFRKGKTDEDEELQHNIVIQPNPTSSSAVISSTENIREIIVTNVLGTIVYKHTYSSPHTEISMGQELSSGMYQIEIVTETGTRLKKNIVKH